MNRFLALSIILILLSSILFAQPATHVVISEVAPMGGASSAFNTGEFIELYNPLPVDVVFGPNVVLVSGNTVDVPANAAQWQVSLSGKQIKAFGFFLIGDGLVTGADVSFPSSKNLANSGSRACVQLLDGVTVIDAFGWDQTTAPLLTAEGKSFKPSGTTSDKKSMERKSGPLSTAPDNLGNAWDSNDNSVDFFENTAGMANPQNSSSPIEVNPFQTGTIGPGTAFIVPGRWEYNSLTTLTVVIKSDTSTIRGVSITKPQPFNWNAANISVQPNTIVSAQKGDTTYLTNFFLAGSDSITIVIAGVSARDTTDEFSLRIRTSTDSTTYGTVQTQPKVLVLGTPRPLNIVKRKEANGVHSLYGKWALVRGIVTVANEFGGPSYLQDSTAGIAVYDSSVSQNVEHGDDVVLLGKISPYNELFELSPCSIVKKISEGNSFDTLAVTIPQIKSQSAAEPFESRFIRVKNITSVTTLAGTPAGTWNVTGSGTNYKLAVGTDSLEVRINPKINLANLPVPNSTFDIVGPLGQYLNRYQILPRSFSDIIVEGAGPRIISESPYESNITQSAIRFTWTTDTPGSSIVTYGTTPSYGTTISDTTAATDHNIVVNGLSPATVYHVKLGSANAVGTTYTSDYAVSTSSMNSSGQINVYFNKSVIISLSRGEMANSVNILSKLVERMNAATYSIDAALYSLSGTVGATVANALIAAKNRGVKIRIIGENGNQSTVPWSMLKSNSIPVIDDGFDAMNGGAGLMHNKFVVVDNRDTTSDRDDWVWTGSWNATDPGNVNDAQNVIEIQDKALANAYTMEFNEMWGSDTESPNASTTRFGARKLNITPHVFAVNGSPVELYFSPSDRTTRQIVRTLNRAHSSINFALLTFTRTDIADALGAKKKAGLKIHGVMDNKTDQGSVFDALTALGIDAHLKGLPAGLLHHKYGIVDADGTSPQQYIITGSHNWSGAAENDNDENTLIIQSQRLANLYLQEFGARYAESGGKEILLYIPIEENIPSAYSLSQNYPNPFNPSTTIEVRLAASGHVTLKVYDVLGRLAASLIDESRPAGRIHVTLKATDLPSGVYFYVLKAGTYSAVKKLMILK